MAVWMSRISSPTSNSSASAAAQATPHDGFFRWMTMLTVMTGLLGSVMSSTTVVASKVFSRV